MTVEIINGDDCITVVLKGELDHHAAAGAREIIDIRLERQNPRLCVFDMKGISFMDSSGIGLILGRKRIAEGYGGRVVLKNLSRSAEKMIKMAGLKNLIIDSSSPHIKYL